MSVNYVDKSTGDLIRVAGQGKAEYGASTERKGDIVIPATTAGLFQSVSVVFAQAMPDNDYAVVIDEGGETWAHGAINVTNKTATGFTLFFFNAAGSDAPQMTFKYRAFKLYTDTEYNNLLNNAVLTSDVTDAVTNGDMNPVTSNAVYDAINTVTNGTINDTNANGNTTINWFKNGRTIIYNIYVSNATTGGSIAWNITLPQNIRPSYAAEGMKGVLAWGGKSVGEVYVSNSGDFITVGVTGDSPNASGQLIAFV